MVIHVTVGITIFLRSDVDSLVNLILIHVFREPDTSPSNNSEERSHNDFCILDIDLITRVHDDPRHQFSFYGDAY